MNATWYHLSMFHFLWLLPVLLLIFLYGAWKKKQSLQMFADSVMLKRLTANISPARRIWKKFFLLCGLFFLILAMARPAWNPVPRDVRRQGRDVAFVLDVSRSMMADDLKPSRLERAKLAIEDCLEILEGDRIALVVFAGNAVIRCPLTQDYGFFRMMLSDISCDSVSRGGTLIGDALRKVEKEVFGKQDRQYKDIVLITDGEDHESFPLEAAKKIGQSGIRLIAVGLGNDVTGTTIVIPGKDGQKEILKYNGQTVRSRLDSNILRQMVNATPGGRYLPVGTGNIDLGRIYKELIAKAAKHEIASQSIQKYEEKFQIFLILAMIFLAFSVILNDRRRSTAVLLGFFCSAMLIQAAPAELKDGNRFYQKKEYGKALKSYQDASVKYPESPYLHFNQGLTAYRMKDYAGAEKAFRKALQAAADSHSQDKDLKAQCRMGLAYTYFRQARRQEDSNLQKAVEGYQKSVSELKGLTQEYPKSENLKSNLKNIQLLARKLTSDLLKQQKQQQKAMQQAQEQSRKLDRLSKEQQKAAQQSSQAGQNQNQPKQTQQQLQNQQKKLSEQTSELSQERQQQKQQNPAADQKLKDAMQKQQKAEQALGRKDYQEAAKQQQKAAEDLKKAKEELDRQQKEQQQKNQTGQKEEQQKKEKQQQDKKKSGSGKEQPKDQSASQSSDKNSSQQEEQFNMNETPQDILDEERQNQRERGRHLRMRQRPVDKDW